MKVYCVMGDEGRSDLDNVKYASTSQEDANQFAAQNDFLNYFGDPRVEVLDVVSFQERQIKKGQKDISEEEMEM